MSGYYNRDELRRLFKQMAFHGGSTGETEILVVVCRECQVMVCYSPAGASLGDGILEAIVSHDCDDLPPEPPALEMPADDEEEEPEPARVLGPIPTADEYRIPEPTTEVMDDLMAEIDVALVLRNWDLPGEAA